MTIERESHASKCTSARSPAQDRDDEQIGGDSGGAHGRLSHGFQPEVHLECRGQLLGRGSGARCVGGGLLLGGVHIGLQEEGKLY